MAQNDVIDLDKMLDEYEAGLLQASAVNQSQKQDAEDLKMQKLTEFGYQIPEPSSSMSQFAPVVDYMKNKKAMAPVSNAGIQYNIKPKKFSVILNNNFVALI